MADMGVDSDCCLPGGNLRFADAKRGVYSDRTIRRLATIAVVLLVSISLVGVGFLAGQRARKTTTITTPSGTVEITK